jgi:hypothetical protein
MMQSKITSRADNTNMNTRKKTIIDYLLYKLIIQSSRVMPSTMPIEHHALSQIANMISRLP